MGEVHFLGNKYNSNSDHIILWVFTLSPVGLLEIGQDWSLNWHRYPEWYSSRMNYYAPMINKLRKWQKIPQVTSQVVLGVADADAPNLDLPVMTSIWVIIAVKLSSVWRSFSDSRHNCSFSRLARCWLLHHYFFYDGECRICPRRALTLVVIDFESELVVDWVAR